MSRVLRGLAFRLNEPVGAGLPLLTGLLTTLLLLAGWDSAALPPRSSITRSNRLAPALISNFPRRFDDRCDEGDGHTHYSS